MAILDVLMRVLHIGGAVLLVGGVAFLVLSLPVLRGAGEGVWPTIRKRFIPILHGAAGALLLSGIYNWWRNVEVYRAVKESSSGAYGALHGLLGMKVLLAIIAIVLLFIAGAKRSEGKGKNWAIALGLMIVVLIFASVVRYLRLNG